MITAAISATPPAIIPMNSGDLKLIFVFFLSSTGTMPGVTGVLPVIVGIGLGVGSDTGADADSVAGSGADTIGVGSTAAVDSMVGVGSGVGVDVGSGVGVAGNGLLSIKNPF